MFEEDVGQFLQLQDFADQAIIHLQNGEVRTVNSIFDYPSVDAELGDHQLDISEPRLTIKEDDAEGVLPKDSVTINQNNYTVNGYPDFDGTGIAYISLVCVE